MGTMSVPLFVVAGLLAALAVRAGDAAWLLLWPALDFLAVGAAYLARRPGVFGKRPDGRLPPLRTLLFLPFLLLTRGLWHVLRWFRRGPAYQELYPGVLIGRRLLPSERPESVQAVFDLTAELPRPAADANGVAYLCHPILDGSVVDLRRLGERLAAAEADAAPGDLYVHCAEGRGRTGMAAALLLARSGRARTAAEALAAIRAVRPEVKWRPVQRRAVERELARLAAEVRPR